MSDLNLSLVPAQYDTYNKASASWTDKVALMELSWKNVAEILFDPAKLKEAEKSIDEVAVNLKNKNGGEDRPYNLLSRYQRAGYRLDVTSAPNITILVPEVLQPYLKGSVTQVEQENVKTPPIICPPPCDCCSEKSTVKAVQKSINKPKGSSAPKPIIVKSGPMPTPEPATPSPLKKGPGGLPYCYQFPNGVQVELKTTGGCE